MYKFFTFEDGSVIEVCHEEAKVTHMDMSLNNVYDHFFEWEAFWRDQECKHDELWDF